VSTLAAHAPQVAPGLVIARADYDDPADAEAVILLMDAYARDPMGGGHPLADDVMAELVPLLASTPNALSLIARLGGEPVGLANCFTAVSTFNAMPLVNIHDVVVLPQYRGQGIARALFEAVEHEAHVLGAGKVTLEVLSGNERATALYASLGYGAYELDPAAGQALFWQKRLI
jgi:ribosomal protein S18 acetylase RimI-like enzyme